MTRAQPQPQSFWGLEARYRVLSKQLGVFLVCFYVSGLGATLLGLLASIRQQKMTLVLWTPTLVASCFAAYSFRLMAKMDTIRTAQNEILRQRAIRMSL